MRTLRDSFPYRTLASTTCGERTVRKGRSLLECSCHVGIGDSSSPAITKLLGVAVLARTEHQMFEVVRFRIRSALVL